MAIVMADPFIEEQLDASLYARYGCTFAERFAVETIRAAGGRAYRRLVHPYPMRTWDLSAIASNDTVFSVLLDLYWRLHGGYGGFRLKAWDEYSSNGHTGTPTAVDQPMEFISGATYQLQKLYGTGSTLSIGRPVRTIFKPVSGSILIAVNGSTSPYWTADTTTGQVTFTAGHEPDPDADDVTAGFLFDFPVRFVSDLQPAHSYRTHSEIQQVSLEELIAL